MASLELDNPAIIFVIGLVISTIIIFVVTKLFRGRTNIGKAFITALIGTLVWVVTYYLFGHGLLATVVGGIAWLLALKGIYRLGWTRAANCCDYMDSVLFCGSGPSFAYCSWPAMI